MVEFYGRLILKGEINTTTGKAWTVEDVPSYWADDVKEWLASRAES